MGKNACGYAGDSELIEDGGCRVKVKLKLILGLVEGRNAWMWAAGQDNFRKPC